MPASLIEPVLNLSRRAARVSIEPRAQAAADSSHAAAAAITIEPATRAAAAAALITMDAKRGDGQFIFVDIVDIPLDKARS